jgi:single-stranded DNA-binding protein
VIIICIEGRLAHEPELKLLSGNHNVCEFRLLETRFTREGEVTEAVTFFCFGEDAEWFCQNAMKGQLIQVAGKQETRSYTPSGSEQTKHFVRYRTNRDFIELRARPSSARQSESGAPSRSREGGSRTRSAKPAGRDDSPGGGLI